MYKQYLNDYERRAEQIRKAAKAIEKGEGETFAVIPNTKPIAHPKTNKYFDRLKTDDVLLLALLFILITSEEKDMTLIIAIGYLFFCGL